MLLSDLSDAAEAIGIGGPLRAGDGQSGQVVHGRVVDQQAAAATAARVQASAPASPRDGRPQLSLRQAVVIAQRWSHRSRAQVQMGCKL